MDLVGDEFINKWTLASNMNLAVNQLDINNKLTEFIKRFFNIKSSNLKQKNSKIHIQLLIYQLKSFHTKKYFIVKNAINA